jgi:acylphosphatase
MLVARRFVLRGHVQGVGFRFFAQELARLENLTGWARNQRDGSVEILAQGEADAMRRFEGRIRRGPSRAHVEHCVVEDEVPSEQMREFSIR